MAYQPKSEAARAVDIEVEKAFSKAQHQWNTYATKLGEGYRTAFKNHRDALKDVQEKYRLAAESAYWALSLLCSTYAGGLAGGLMAPWLEKQGIITADGIHENITFPGGRTGAIGKSTATTALAASVKKRFFESPPFEPSKTLLEPEALADKLGGEIGTFFSQLRAWLNMELQDIDTDDKKKARNNTEHIISTYSSVPIVQDYPEEKHMPDPEKVAKETELGIWVAWANVRDYDYWKERLANASTGSASRKRGASPWTSFVSTRPS
jgi:hypothetical protein